MSAFALEMMIGREQDLPQMQRFQGNLKEVDTGDLRNIEFHCQHIRCQGTNIGLHAKDKF